MSELKLFFTLFSQAQEVLRLTDAVNIALKNGLGIQLAKNRIEADSIKNNIGIAGGLPLVTANINDNEQITSVNQKLNTGTSIQRNNAAANNLNSNITGSILLYNGGRVIATKKRLGQLQLQSQLRLDEVPVQKLRFFSSLNHSFALTVLTNQRGIHENNFSRSRRLSICGYVC